MENTDYEVSEDVQVYPTFEAMGIRDELLRGIVGIDWLGIYAYGFDKPSAVQQRSIVPLISGRDIIVQSQSGTGKTAVFCLAALSVVDSAIRYIFKSTIREPQVLILSNTRELAE